MSTKGQDKKEEDPNLDQEFKDRVTVTSTNTSNSAAGDTDNSSDDKLVEETVISQNNSSRESLPFCDTALQSNISDSESNNSQYHSDVRNPSTGLSLQTETSPDYSESKEKEKTTPTEKACAERMGDDSDGDKVQDSGSSASEDDYESADEGEEIHTDAQTLEQLEESLTEEEKEERCKSAQEMKVEGNALFRDGSYKGAIKMYSRALRTCPLKFVKERAVMYSNRSACKMRMEENEAAIKDCSKAIELHPQYLKPLMRRAELYEKTDKLDEALADHQKVLELDPSQHASRAACMKLPEQIKERNEKLKEEMLGKLKDLGNMILRPFGLSTNNFQLNQDPNTGGYSINFNQSPRPDNGK